MDTITHKYTGEAITFVETMAQTGGKYLLIEVALPPFGEGPPLHIHDAFTEEFEVLSGKLSIQHNSDQLLLEPGTKVLVQPKDKHTFKNEQDAPVVFRVKLTPGKFFEQSARIHYGLMADGLTKDDGSPKNIAHTALILTMQNTLVAGLPIGIQRFLFNRIVKKNIKKGTYNDLQKYVSEPLDEIFAKL